MVRKLYRFVWRRPLSQEHELSQELLSESDDESAESLLDDEESELELSDAINVGLVMSTDFATVARSGRTIWRNKDDKNILSINIAIKNVDT